MIKNVFDFLLLIQASFGKRNKNTLFSIDIHIYGKIFSRSLQNMLLLFNSFSLVASAASSIYAICIVNVAHLNGVIV